MARLINKFYNSDLWVKPTLTESKLLPALKIKHKSVLILKFQIKCILFFKNFINIIQSFSVEYHLINCFTKLNKLFENCFFKNSFVFMHLVKVWLLLRVLWKIVIWILVHSISPKIYIWTNFLKKSHIW